jgi:hypothetical protein
MKLYKIFPAVFAATVALALANTASAATWYVNSSTGSDANDCMTATTACMTINAAIVKASANDTISVADGNYNESVNINKSGLKLQGAQAGVDARSRSGAESVITNTCSPVQITADNVTLDGFTVQGSTMSDPCTIAGIWMNPGFSGIQGGAQILNNIVQNNIAGIEFDNSGTMPAKVQFNLIRSNNNSGPGSGNGIETDFGLMNATIDNNKFIGQTNSSFIVMGGTSTSGVTVSNNTLDAGIALFQASGITITGNSSIGNTVDGTIYIGGGNSGITVSSNVLNNGVEGVVVDNPYASYGVVANTSVTISPNNCIAGNSTNGLKVVHSSYTGVLNAMNNWWGAASGPNYNGAGPGTGDKITDPDHVVTFTPFLSSKTGTPCAPPPVGPPTNANQCKNGGWQTFNTPRSFKNQGDCIQYVNTGK